MGAREDSTARNEVTSDAQFVMVSVYLSMLNNIMANES